MAITVKYLEGLGIDKETAEKIFAERSKEIETDKIRYSELETKFTEKENSLKTLSQEFEMLKQNNADAEAWKTKFEALQKDIEEKDEQAKAEKADLELTQSIEAVFGDRKFTSEYVRNGIISDMKTEIAKPDNKGKGYLEIFEALTKDKEGIFANPNPPGDMLGIGDIGKDIADDKIREVMGLPIK